jgi:hypothetical protein
MSSKETLDFDSTDSKTSETVLDILDTYHDFCKGERKKKSRGEDEDSGDKRVTIMRTYLPLLLSNKYTNFKVADNYTQNVKTLSKDKITSVSKIEHETIDLFEEKYKAEIQAAPETKEILTMADIIKSYTANPREDSNALWLKFKNNESNRVLEIQKDGIDLDADGCEALSSFILNYFFFTSLEKDIHVTFDAADGTVGEIFRDDAKVKNIIFPQTIADSATTSLNVLKGRCDYIFPSASTEIDFKSNEFSQKDYRIYFKNNTDSPFSNTNPYGFSIIIEKKTDATKQVVIPFSSTQTEGPSVNYIIDILNTLQISKNDTVKLQKISKKSSIVNLGLALDKYPPIKRDIFQGIKSKSNGILPDLKRGGDHEAVNAAKYVIDTQFPYTMFTTIDMLCALKARKEKINTIWQTSERLVLYRFPTIKGEQQEKYSFILKVFDCLDLISKIESILIKKEVSEGKSLFQKEIEQQKNEITTRALQAVANIQANVKNRLCLEALNALLRIRIKDLDFYLSSLTLTITDIDTDKFSKAKTDLQIFVGKNNNQLLASEDLKKEGAEFVYTATVAIEKEGVDKRGKKKITKEMEARTVTQSELNTDQQNLKAIYTKLLTELKTIINIDINVAEESLDKKLKIFKPLTEDIVIKKQGQADKTIVTFSKTDHSVFNYVTGPFFRFYEMMLLLEDLKASYSTKRDFPLKVKKFLQKDNTNEYYYFGIIEEILEQFKQEPFKNELTDILNFTDKALTKATEKATTSIDRESYLRYFLLGEPKRGIEIEGVLTTIVNYYTKLSTATPAIPRRGTQPAQERKPAVIPHALSVLQGGSFVPQKGGATGEYYELSDLLFSISTKAAAYLESAFSKQYTYYTLQTKIKYLNKVWSYIREFGQESLYNMNLCIDLFEEILLLHNALLETKEYDDYIKTVSDAEKIQISHAWSLVNGYRKRFEGYNLNANKQNYKVNIRGTDFNQKPIGIMNKVIEHLNAWLTLVESKNITTAIPFPTLGTIFTYLKSQQFQVPQDEEEYVYSDAGTKELPWATEEREYNTLVGEYNELSLPALPDAVTEYSGTERNGIYPLLEELQEEWEYGLQQIRNTEGYTFTSDANFGTHLFFTAFLAHRFDKTQEYLLQENNVDSSVFTKAGFPLKDFKEIIEKYTTEDEQAFVKVFILTLLENIQNPRKYSFFLKGGYTNRYFDSKGDWNQYLGSQVLPAILQFFNASEEGKTNGGYKTAFYQMPASTIIATHGGKRKRYGTTRKNKQRLQKSHKYGKTMRQKKH